MHGIHDCDIAALDLTFTKNIAFKCSRHRENTVRHLNYTPQMLVEMNTKTRIKQRDLCSSKRSVCSINLDKQSHTAWYTLRHYLHNARYPII